MDIAPEAQPSPSTPAPFNFNGHAVRAITKDDGSAWFVAKDVCETLGIVKYRDAIADLDSDERVSLSVDTPGGRQEMSAVNESGCYALIFKSRHPDAHKFRKWVTSEVLPALRKTGTYSMPNFGKISLADYELWWRAFCHLLSGRGVNASTVAAKAGVSRTTLYEIRNRKDFTHLPKMPLLRKLSEAFDRTVEDLIALGGQMTAGAKPSGAPLDTAAKHQTTIRGYLELGFPLDQALAMSSRAMNRDYGTDFHEVFPLVPAPVVASADPEQALASAAEVSGVAQFIKDACMAAFGAKVFFSDLYDSYVLWCRYHSPNLILSRIRVDGGTLFSENLY